MSESSPVVQWPHPLSVPTGQIVYRHGAKNPLDSERIGVVTEGRIGDRDHAVVRLSRHYLRSFAGAFQDALDSALAIVNEERRQASEVPVKIRGSQFYVSRDPADLTLAYLVDWA
jgi:hypothetical protein